MPDTTDRGAVREDLNTSRNAPYDAPAIPMRRDTVDVPSTGRTP